MFIALSTVFNSLFSAYALILYLVLIPIFLWAILIFKKKVVLAKKIQLIFFLPLLLFLILTSPLSRMAIYFKEKDYPPSLLSALSQNDLDQRSVIIILSGGILFFDKEKKIYKWGNTFARFMTPILLAKNNPNTFFIFSYGLPDHRVPQDLLNEGPSMLKFAQELGIDSSRMIVSAASANTFEEAQNIAPLVKKMKPDVIYLSTSANHLERALLTFKKNGISAIPIPGHYNVPPDKSELYKMAVGNIGLISPAIHEWIGKIVYSWTGKI